MNLPATTVEHTVDERLAEGAPIQWRLSEEQCGEACALYHGTRGYRRALGVQYGIRRDTGFLLEALGRLARRGTFSRVLISAAADCGTFAHLVAAYGAAGVPLRATLVDRCATPLRVNAWYSQRVGVPIETHQMDALDFRTNEPFDVVCTHDFLGQFDPAGRRRLMARWHAVLRPGGAVVTAVGLRPHDLEPLVRFGAAEVRALRERANGAVEEARLRFGLAPETLKAWTETFVRRKARFPIHSAAAVQDLFEQVGFRLAVLRTAESPGRVGARRLRVVAERVAVDRRG